MNKSNWEKLENLIEMNQFELLKDTNSRVQDHSTDLRLIYLMNDAVESFLVFRNATMTGSYVEDFEGEIWLDAGISDENRRYIILHQEDNVVTIFFENLDFEVHLFDYSQVGHFWIEGYEYLRQLEFKLAILKNKYDYIGPEACTAKELELVELYEFPPLGYSCYPATPPKYVIQKEDPWNLSEEAIQVMKGIAEEAGDQTFSKWLTLYKKIPNPWMGKLIAKKLHETKHIRIVQVLMKRFKEACETYELRYELREEHGDGQAGNIHKKLEEAKVRLEKLQQKGMEGTVYMEESFYFDDDGIEDKVYLVTWNYGKRNTRITIEQI